MIEFTYNGYRYVKIIKEKAIEIQHDVFKDPNKVLIIVGSDVLCDPESCIDGGEIVKGDIETSISIYENYMDRIWSMTFDEIYIFLGTKI